MDSLNVSRESLGRLVERTVSKHPGFILFQKKGGWFAPPLVRVTMGRHSVSKVTVYVEVRFGLDAVEQVQTLTRLIRKNMLEMTGLSVDKIKINIGDVYDE